MKKILVVLSIPILMFSYFSPTSLASDVEINFEKQSQTLDLRQSSSIDFSVKFKVDPNFHASIILSVVSSNLPTESIFNFSPNPLNQPYNNSILKVEVFPGITIGKYSVVIEAKNGTTVFDRDTCYLEITKTSDKKWTILKSELWSKSYNKSVNGISFEKNGNIWFTCGSKIVKLQNKVISTFESGINSITAIVPDTSGNVWCASRSGLIKFDGNYFTIYNSKNSEIPSDTISSVLVDKNNNLWIGSNIGLVKYNGINWVTYKVHHPEDYPYDIISTMCIDSTGKIWTASRDGLVANFNGTDWNLFNLSGFPSSPPNYSSSIACDKSHNIWIGNGWSNFCKFDGNSQECYSYQNNIPFPIKYLALDKEDNIWLSNNNITIGKYKDSSWVLFNRLNSDYPWDNPNMITVDDSNNIWFGCNGGIAIYGNIQLDQIINGIEVDTKKGNSNFSIYPNPVTEDIINIRLNEESKNEVNYEIITPFGKTVLSGFTQNNVSRFEINTEFLSSGLYFIILRFDGKQELRELVIYK